MANDGPIKYTKFADPKVGRYGVLSTDAGYVRDGFYLRRVVRDHNTPAVRIPREMVRRLGWRQGDLLSLVQVDDAVVIAKLCYGNPMEVAHDQADEARRKPDWNRPEDDHAS